MHLQLNYFRYFFQMKIFFIQCLYIFSFFIKTPVFFFTTCYNWNDKTSDCVSTNLKMFLLLLLFIEDIFFSYHKNMELLSYILYFISFLLFLTIFSLHVNVYLDITTFFYIVFLFHSSYYQSNQYEKINDTNNETNDEIEIEMDYPNVEVKSFVRKKPHTIYYQATL